MEKILVIIVTYNAMKWAEKCFSSIGNSNIPLDVYVIDNGSNDGTQDYINKNYPEVIFKQSDINLGFGKANNIGLQYAIDNKYDYVYLLNQDAWINNDTIEVLVNVHKKNKEYGILSPMQIQANMQHLDTNFYYNILNSKKKLSFLNDLYFQNLKDIYDVEDVMAAHWLIYIDCLKTVGGFSPTFPHYGEDENFVDRVIYHGYKIGVVPAARAIHDREFRQLTLKQILRFFYTSTLVYLSDITTKYYLFRIFRLYLSYAFRYKTLRHYKYIFVCLKDTRDIFKNKETSKLKGSFLKIR